MNDYLKGKRAIVTGGAGVIGLELLRKLNSRKALVLSVDKKPLPESKDLSGIKHIQKDLATDGLDELRDFTPQVVFHLAASFERSKESAPFWDVNWNNNVFLSHRIVDMARENRGLEVLVFASSYLVYSPTLYMSRAPRSNAAFLKEDSLKEPRNITGSAKFYTEKEIEFITEYCNLSLRSVHGRIFRVYGRGSKDVISGWVRSLLDDREIEVYNKENSFDYIFAEDVAEGLIRCAENPMARGAINLGSGGSKSIEELLEILKKYFPDGNIRLKNNDSPEPFENSGADISLLKQCVGWSPATSLEDGVKEIINFEKNKAKENLRWAENSTA